MGTPVPSGQSALLGLTGPSSSSSTSNTQEVFTVKEGSKTAAVATPSTKSPLTAEVSTPGHVVIPGSSEVTTPGSITTCTAQNVVSFVPLNSGNEYQESSRISSAAERAKVGDSQNPVTSNVFLQRFPGKAEATYSKAFSSMQSTFKLLKNQPFSFSIGLFEAPKDWIDIVKDNQSSFFTPTNRYQIPTSDRFDTCCFIEWGGYMLGIYRQTGNISLFVGKEGGGFELVGTNKIPANANAQIEGFSGMHLVVYPIGNQIIVYDGSNEPGINSSRYDAGAAVFTLDSTVITGQGAVAVTTYLGAANYRYNHVLHVGSGTLTSPKASISVEGPLTFSVDYEGKVGVGSDLVDKETKDFTYSVPDQKSTDSIYTFLKDTSIEATCTKKVSKGIEISYTVTLKSNTTTTKDFCRNFSPRIYAISMRINPQGRKINLSPDPQINNADIINIQVTQTMEGSTATVVLNNRKLASGSIPKSGGKYDTGNFVGVKPITIKYGIQKDNETAPIATKFTGYITNRSFTRGGKGAHSTVTIQCEDVSIKAKTTPGINLPIFDGMCHLGAIYFLAREAGYNEDEIVLGREGDLLKNSIEGDTVNFTGGCFAGHPGNPGNLDLKTHLILPLDSYKTSPHYMFQMGTSLWDCMHEIREFTGYVIYGNNEGKLVYGPLGAQFKRVEQKFSEIAGVTGVAGKYDEFQGDLLVKHNPMESRNGSVAMGYIIPATSGGDQIEQPLVHVIRDELWPENISNAGYIPWQRIIFVRNPLWNELSKLEENNIERFNRAKRPRIGLSWKAWGQTKLSPYDQITIDELQGDETNLSNQSVIITSISDNLDATTKSFFSTFESEVFDPSLYDFSPHV